MKFRGAAMLERGELVLGGSLLVPAARRMDGV
jgi:hypothetical protein